jgi:hypothetical protein
MFSGVHLVRRISVAAIFSLGLIACAMSTPSGPRQLAPQNVTGTYNCVTNSITGAKECTMLYTWPSGYVFCFPDAGAYGGCGSFISGLSIELTSDSQPNPPHYWHNYVTWNFDQYNETIGYGTSSPYINLQLIDYRGTPQGPAAQIPIFIDRSNCGRLPHNTNSAKLDDSLNIEYLTGITDPTPVNAVSTGTHECNKYGPPHFP